jgi:hypothetical protein
MGSFLRRRCRLITAIVLGLSLLCASGASAQGILEGVVTDTAGPVAGAEVAAVEAGGMVQWTHTVSRLDGHYSLSPAWASASVGVTPPSESSDGYFEQDGVNVPPSGATVLNPLLPPASGEGRLSGVAEYQPSIPDAGIEVIIEPVNRPIGEVFYAKTAITDSDGAWNYGAISAGTYELIFVVQRQNERPTEATQYVTVGQGSDLSILTTLNGSPPDATLVVTASEPGGAPVTAAAITITPIGGSALPSASFTESYKTVLPTGTYSVTVSPAAFGPDADTATGTVELTAGHVTPVRYELPPLAVPTGTEATNTARDVEYLNAERAQWGLPAGLTANPIWSQACAAHNKYLAANKLLEHPEQPGLPFYSPGGNWGGTHSVLAVGTPWEPGKTPWEEAPIHLNQLFTPDLRTVGIDESAGYSCATTWPGIAASVSPPGAVITYPGDGSSGFPPSENAGESPFVPGQFVGIPQGTVAGRELFVYEERPSPLLLCPGCVPGAPTIVAASLRGPNGTVPVKWVDGTSPPGGYLTGAIVIPVSPLAPNTTYHAEVTLAADLLTNVGQVSHSWSFATGAQNITVHNPIVPPAPNRQGLSQLSISPRKFKAARRGATISRVRVGATVRYRDISRATAQFQVLRRTRGRRHGHLCVAPSRHNSRAKKCQRLVSVFRFSRRDRAAANHFYLSGRGRRGRLPPGGYVLSGFTAGRVPAIVSFWIIR